MKNKFSFNNLIESVSKLIREKEKQSSRKKSLQHEIENSVLVLAATVLRCDRNFTGNTENYIGKFLIEQFGTEGLNQRFKFIHNHLETGTEPFTKIACKELKMLTTYDSRLSILRFLFGVANTDDFVNAKETRCIHRISCYLSISENDFKELKQSFLRQNNPYHVLGINEDASIEQIKAAYRKMVLKFHPDKKRDEVIAVEEGSKFREIQHAFDILKQQKEKR